MRCSDCANKHDSVLVINVTDGLDTDSKWSLSRGALDLAWPFRPKGCKGLQGALLASNDSIAGKPSSQDCVADSSDSHGCSDYTCMHGMRVK